MPLGVGLAQPASETGAPASSQSQSQPRSRRDVDHPLQEGGVAGGAEGGHVGEVEQPREEQGPVLRGRHARGSGRARDLGDLGERVHAVALGHGRRGAGPLAPALRDAPDERLVPDDPRGPRVVLDERVHQGGERPLGPGLGEDRVEGRRPRAGGERLALLEGHPPPEGRVELGPVGGRRGYPEDQVVPRLGRSVGGEERARELEERARVAEPPDLHARASYRAVVPFDVRAPCPPPSARPEPPLATRTAATA